VALALGHRLEYGLFRMVEAAAAAASWRQRIALGVRVGRVWHLVDARHRSVARQNAARAFPDWPEGQIVALVRSNFQHLGATAAEFLGLPGVSTPELLDRYRFEGIEHLEEARSLGRGTLVLTGHLGNWELASTALAAKGYPFRAVARKIKNPWIDRRILGLRSRFGTELIAHRNAVRPVLRALREGGMVAFLLDQRASRREAVPSLFFGQRVSTNQGLAVLALRTGAPVVPGFDERVGDTHVIRFGSAIAPPAEGPREERVRRLTEVFDATIEAAVRHCPEQWFWVHRRWRLPKELEG